MTFNQSLIKKVSIEITQEELTAVKFILAYNSQAATPLNIAKLYNELNFTVITEAEKLGMGE